METPASFTTYKQRFFEMEQLNSQTASSFETSLIKDYEQEIENFSYLHISLLEEEFNLQLAVLKDQEEQDDEFRLYCYYCCLMLEHYFKNYPHAQKARYYENQKREIAKKLPATFKNLEAPINESFAVTGTSKMKSLIALINILRLQIVFSRITVQQGLLTAEKLRWFEKLDTLFGKHFDAMGMANSLNAANGIFSMLSVGLYAGRLLINLSLIVKHTFDASKDKDKQLERLLDELYKRRFQLVNDGAWGVVNALTNYAKYFKIAAPTTNLLLGVFLSVDIVVLACDRYLSQKEYEMKRSYYENELKNKSGKEKENIEAKLKLLNENWAATNASYLCSISAAFLLMSSFSATMFISIQALVPVCFVFCTVGVAMYITADQFGDFYKKYSIWHAIEENEGNHDLKLKASQEMQGAGSHFAKAMVVNITVPLFMMTLVATSWPAALAVAALYMSYQVSKAYITPGAEEAPALPGPGSTDSVEDEPAVQAPFDKDGSFSPQLSPRGS